MLDELGYKHTRRICYCFSSATMISRRHLNVTLLPVLFCLLFLRFKVMYKVVQIWPGQTVTFLHTNSPGHIWTTLYLLQFSCTQKCYQITSPGRVWHFCCAFRTFHIECSHTQWRNILRLSWISSLLPGNCGTVTCLKVRPNPLRALCDWNTHNCFFYVV
jgi:hypothetical protein